MKPQIGEALTAPQSPVIFYLRLSGILSLTQRKPLRHRAGMSMTLGHTACERKNNNSTSVPRTPPANPRSLLDGIKYLIRCYINYQSLVINPWLAELVQNCRSGARSLSLPLSLSFWNFTHANLNTDLSSLAKRSFPEHGLVSRLLFSSEYAHCFGLLGFPRSWLPNLAVVGTPIH